MTTQSAAASGIVPRLTAAAKKTIELDADPDFRLPASLRGLPEPRRVLISTYYDTPAGSLTRSSISLRRRQEGPASSWRLELPAEEGRIELEEAVSTATVPAGFLVVLAAHLQRTRLVPAATIRTHRTTIACAVGASHVRVSHDRVEVLDGEPGAADFAVVRVDLLDGVQGARDEIVARLVEAGAGPARRRARSPIAPGLAVPRPREPGAWFAEQLDDILTNDPGTRLGVDPEHLHAHRVAIRRLRAALRDEPLKTELGWIGGALGAVRDLDVLTAHLREESSVLEPEERAAFRPVLARLARRRARARAELMAALDSPRYLALLDALAQVAAGPAETGEEPAAIAASQFRKLREEIRRAGPAPDETTLHELRKRAKRIRYAAERARKAGDQSLRPVVDRAKALQDVLGASQDATVAEIELRELVGEVTTPARAVAIGRLIERERAERGLAFERWPGAWRKLEQAGRKAWPDPKRAVRRPRRLDRASGPAAEPMHDADSIAHG